MNSRGKYLKQFNDLFLNNKKLKKLKKLNNVRN